jgi:Tfp pilus assembly PilM family ATPase
MGVTHHIGLEVAEHAFRFVEIQQQDRQSTILRADTVETEHNYASSLLFDLPYDRDLARAFITELAKIYHRHTVYAESLSIVLPSTLPLVCTIPLDNSLSDFERKEQLQWECTMLGNFPRETPLQILSHELARTRHATQHLAVALPQATVDFLTQTCEYLTLDLASIDIDHFTMENVLRRLYSHEATVAAAVIGLHASHCSAGRYSNGQYHGYRMASVTYKEHYTAQILRLLDSLPGGSTAKPIEQVYVFGDDANAHIVDALENILQCRVARCIPLADTDIPESIGQGFGDNGERLFDASAAAALLGLP